MKIRNRAFTTWPTRVEQNCNFQFGLWPPTPPLLFFWGRGGLNFHEIKLLKKRKKSDQLDSFPPTLHVLQYLKPFQRQNERCHYIALKSTVLQPDLVSLASLLCLQWSSRSSFDSISFQLLAQQFLDNHFQLSVAHKQPFLQFQDSILQLQLLPKLRAH